MKSIELNVNFKVVNKSIEFENNGPSKVVVWEDKIEKITFCMFKENLDEYLAGKWKSVKVWMLNKGGVAFYATMRQFIDGVSYIYDTDKIVIGVLFHDDLKNVWRYK